MTNMKYLSVFFSYCCIVWLVSAETFVANEPSQLFRVIPLGDSALLVTWVQDFASVPYLFLFSYQELVNGTWSNKVCTWQIASNNETQAKIFNLKRRTKYRIFIENEKSENLDEYVVKSETGDICTSAPVKPDFEYGTSIINGFTLAVDILWLPCGKKRECNKRRAGSYFHVKYRIKGEPFSSRTVEERQQDKITVTGFDLRPSRIYEFSVVSIAGGFKTESDIQEVFFFAATGPVQSLIAIPLGGSSFFVTWRAPREMTSAITEYDIIHAKNLTEPLHDLYSDKLKSYDPNVTQIKISGLEKNTTYRIYVVPRTEFGVGTENFVEGTTFGSCTTYPFKPSFYMFLVKNKQFLPALKIQWLPCGRMDDCRGEKPGSSFYVRYKFKEEPTFNVLSETEDDCIFIHDCLPNKTYTFTVVSVYDNFERESDPQEISIPKLEPTEDMAEAIVGQNCTLKCKSFVSPHIRWFRNDIEISRSGKKYTKLENGNLLIKKSDLTNSGVFKCYNGNLTSSSPVAKIFFSVKEATHITNMHPFSILEVHHGQNVSLNCSVEKDRTLSVATGWLKNGQHVKNNTDWKSGRPNDALNIFNVTENDSGNYTCTAVTRLDEASATVSVRVKINKKPIYNSKINL